MQQDMYAWPVLLGFWPLLIVLPPAALAQACAEGHMFTEQVHRADLAYLMILNQPGPDPSIKDRH